MRIVCWSGPRNLSTAMMYSFGARADFKVMDEPFYAAFLAATGADHPMAAEVVAAGAVDPDAVARACAAEGAPHVYQKHMTHHLLPGFPRAWMAGAAHVFLLRHPARVLASYAAKREAPTLEDIGFVQQTEIFEALRAEGVATHVIDSADIRQDPEAALSALCEAVGVPFDRAMLSWPAGGHPADGIWAAHWYDAVHRSTGFAGPEGPLPDVSEALRPVLEAALPHYTRLKAHAISL